LDVSYERPATPVPIDATEGIHVYRILQEALTNVARHGGTKQAQVRLRCQDGSLQLEVEDHGKGFSANGQPRGLGLVTMSERAELLGGTIDFDTPPGGGTLVRLRVPIRSQAAAGQDALAI
jgi:two-component system, NarL family, sensor histidine kinase UhpB